MELPIWVVDAFAQRPFEGNPAGIVLLDEPIEDKTMQAIAAEMRHAETAFIRPREGEFDLRWFTPEVEVELCGHATLASAHILFQEHLAPEGQTIRFHTLSGILTAERFGKEIQLDFPQVPVLPPNFPLLSLQEALGVSPVFIAPTRMDVLIELRSEQEVRSLAPALDRLAQIETRGFIVTARSSAPGVDFVSRFFAPRVGVDEDPVTGSAHCTLAVYWGAKLGKAELTGYQASQRGGLVRVRLHDDRVNLIGEARTFLNGKIRV